MADGMKESTLTIKNMAMESLVDLMGGSTKGLEEKGGSTEREFTAQTPTMREREFGWMENSTFYEGQWKGNERSGKGT